MKHIKLFENIENDKWIIIVENIYNSSEKVCYLFDDKESAQNYLIITVNDYIKDELDEDYTDDDMVLTIEEAENWIDERMNNVNILLFSIENIGKFELPDKLKILAKSKKYNL